MNHANTKRRILGLLMLSTVMLMFCSLNLACSPTFGPVVKEHTTFVRMGHPGRVMDNAEVKVLAPGATKPTKQDIGGWYVMPPDHWEAMVERIQALSAKVKELEGQ
jgi:hypothetical protein